MSEFWPAPTAADRAAYADAEVRPYWLAALPPRDPAPPVSGIVRTDLCIVGGGFTGLWAALHAKADDPDREVAVLEADTVGFGASGRNGGFVVSSLTHGLGNGLARFAGRDADARAPRGGELRRASRPTSPATASTAGSS